MRRYAPVALFVVAALAIAAALVVGLSGGDGDTPRAGVRTVAVQVDPLAGALRRQADALRAAQAVSSGRLDTLLAQDPLDLRVPQITQEGITLRDVVVTRRGTTASGEATVDLQQLGALAPADISNLRYDAGASGTDGVVVKADADGPLGLSLPVTIRVTARDGNVVAIPEGLPIDDQTLFSDPRIHVNRLTARPADGGLRIRAEATVTG
ncbi:hypothetical protein [Capillimicrobium parvum]|uniref:Uncharacterized protein n=1 Tax=Capillimicrobium parvum TaxID=2884022 RepID=A0A9E6XUA5_9ACTN|nr:hypothetical protein [Capillimicrobium parvum]UGS34595.1 hypothetical protein DSM104329_00974 [Capillimicrobium parvum]